MGDMIRKIVVCEVKEVADRVLEFIGSTEEQDRDGEVIKASGWNLENYNKNPVFMWAHRYDQPPIGKSLKTWTRAGKLKFNIEFAPKETYEFADTIYKLYKGGFLKATSVGFVPDLEGIIEGDGEKTPKKTYTKQELLELSAVPIPSNPDALVQARDAGLITVKQLEVITKPEVTEEYIRIPAPGEEGKHDGHRIRTITLSEKDGIKALYCGECKVVITYLFDKDKWTMAEARDWVREHGKEIDLELIDIKGAIPYRRTPLADEDAEWDAGAEVKQAEVEDLKIMCAIVEGDPENKTSYKLPHHRAGGDHACVWNGVRASVAVLMGARGGVDASAESIAGAKTHIGKHYKDFDKGEPPWEKGVSQAEIKDELDYVKTLITEEGLNDDNKEVAWDVVRAIMGLPGSQIPVDIQSLITKEIKPKVIKPELTEEKIIQIVGRVVTEAIAKAQGKV